MTSVGTGTGGCDVDSLHVAYGGRWYVVSVERHSGPQVYRKGVVGRGQEVVVDGSDPVLALALAQGLDG